MNFNSISSWKTLNVDIWSARSTVSRKNNSWRETSIINVSFIWSYKTFRWFRDYFATVPCLRLCKFIWEAGHESRDKTGGVYSKTHAASFHAVNHLCKCKNWSLLRSAIGRSIEYMMPASKDRGLIAQLALSKEGFRQFRVKGAPAFIPAKYEHCGTDWSVFTSIYYESVIQAL